LFVSIIVAKYTTFPRRYNGRSGEKQKILEKQFAYAISGESTKHGPLVHGPPSLDPVHGPGPSKYGLDPWTGSMDRVHGPPNFTET